MSLVKRRAAVTLTPGRLKKLGEKQTGWEELTPEELKDALQQAGADADDAVLAAPEAMAEAQEKLGVLAENVMRGMLESDDVTSVDIREMRLLSTQLSIGKCTAEG